MEYDLKSYINLSFIMTLKRPLEPGRPAKFKEEYCKEFVKLRSQGYSVVRVAALWDVSSDTILIGPQITPVFPSL